MKYFDSIYLINLPERVDRLKSATAELARVGWSIGSGGVEIFPACRFHESAGFPNAAARGCFHSHLECLRRALLEKRRRVLILEDDVAFTSSLPSLTASIKSKLESLEWDFVYFGHEDTGDIPRANSKTTNEEFQLVPWNGHILTTHFYGVNGRRLSKLVKHLESILSRPAGDPEGGPMTIDGAFYWFRQREDFVQTMIANPKLGWQRPSRSDLTPNLIDAFPILHPVTTLLRNLKHLADRRRS